MAWRIKRDLNFYIHSLGIFVSIVSETDCFCLIRYKVMTVCILANWVYRSFSFYHGFTSWINIPKDPLLNTQEFVLAVQLTFFDLSSKVLGNILGKTLTTTGRRNSMKGTTINTRNGTSLNRSATVRKNYKQAIEFCKDYYQ